MAYFHLKLVAPRPSFPFDTTAAEGTAMGEHQIYWEELAERKIAIAVGPVFDPKGPFGMAIVEAENEAEAEALGAADPVIMADLGFRYETAPIPSLILR
ncbi:YciI family protein [Rhizobium alvei]|uniref:YciI family protein n=1 Tax=Rhizobium alvei TaxID=1132659 RepID=A0ABT8YMF7_9HYPH|nr:YciI family protein [Rhizobium alvei]MDO6964905.1 YciI family protein [Rhizobium alvei]